MKTNWKRNIIIVCCLSAGALVPTACSSLIDDDTDICLAEYDAEYELRLLTNEEHELARVLADRTDIADALRAHLSGVFTDNGRELDLSFYDSAAAQPRFRHDEVAMSGPTKTMHVSLPVGQQMHLAVANMKDNGPAQFVGFDAPWRQAAIALNMTDVQPATEPAGEGKVSVDGIDTGLPADFAPNTAVASQKTGIFTGRKHLSAPVFGPYNYYMPLYIANSAAAIAIDPRTAPITDVMIFTTGFATSLSVADSTYTFDNMPLVRAEQVNLSDTTKWLCFCTVNFPSKDLANAKQAPISNLSSLNSNLSTRSAVDTDEPFIYQDCLQNFWRYECYVKMKDGTITRTLITIRHPLRAGQLKVIRGHIDGSGVIRVNETEAGTSIDTKWEPGYEHEIVI